MLQRTPFHERTAALNQTMLWRHWAGHAVPDRYQMSTKREYYAVRNGAGLLDTSPLYKYRISGPEAESWLAGVLARDARRCRVDQAQYTLWCDERGFVIEDGVLVRTAPDEFLLTSAEPNLAWFDGLRTTERVEISDVSADYGILALQGPRAREILAEVAPDAAALPYFGAVHTKLADAAVVVTRTGYTGDLGYEVWARAHDALAVWDALVAAGEGRGLLPYGSAVLHLARIEAGMLLVDVDYRPSRYAWTDEQRATPAELGLGWMVRDAAERRFVGSVAIATATARWRQVGLTVDWADHQRVHRERGQPAPEDHTPVEEAMAVYGRRGDQVGFATSFAFSPLLKQHVALARVPVHLAKVGTPVGLEILVDHLPVAVAATVTRLPFFDPERRTA